MHKTTTRDSQRSQEQWIKESKKETRWKDVTKVIHEAGLLSKERKASWHKSLKGGRSLNTVDKMNRVDLADSLRLLRKICDEAELVLVQTTL